MRTPSSPLTGTGIADAGIEILFMATPHEQSREWVPEAIERGIRVIDLSGAWRLKEDRNRAVYKLHDADPALAAELQAEAVYRLPGAASRRDPHSAPGCQSRLLLDLDHPRAGAAGSGRTSSISITASSAMRSPASAEQAKLRRRRPTSCTRRTISPPTRSSVIATPANCWSSCISAPIRFSSRRICCRFRVEFFRRSISG